MTPTVNVLISLHKGYGLGDSVSMSSVLRHVVAARPHWKIDYRAEDGKHQVGRGIVANTFSYDEMKYPSPHYDAEVQLCLFPTYYGWSNRPNTVVATCLHERFGLPWNAWLGRYQVQVSQNAHNWAVSAVPTNAVALHFKGVTAKDKKDLTDEQASAICDHVQSLGYVPYVMDNVPLGYSAEVNCAIIQQCKAFVGIDSGPAKCAGATDTPALVVWTKHHPVQFYDPALNVCHLIPYGCHDNPPVCGAEGVVQFFESNYRYRVYFGDCVPEINMWLSEVLG